MKVNHDNQNGKQIEQQMRLRVHTDVGVMELVPWRRAGTGPLRWAWPGRASVTYGQVVRICRESGWPQPELTPARVVRRAETEEPPEPPAPPTGGDHE